MTTTQALHLTPTLSSYNLKQRGLVLILVQKFSTWLRYGET